VSEIVLELVGKRASLYLCEAARELGLDLFGATLTLGSILVDQSISTFCCSPNSWQKPLMAAAIPRYCSFAECNWCDMV
jgi:hypothetical protein